MSAQLKPMPSLGRPYNLGTLVDIRTEQLIEKSLWNSKTVKSATKKDKTSHSDFKVLGDDTTRKKFSYLNMPASQRLSYIASLIDLQGSAEYLKDEKSSDGQSRVSLHYRSTTHSESLDVKQLGPVQFPDTLKSCSATHIVTGVTYGADAFFVFDRSVNETEDFRKVSDAMQAQVKTLFDAKTKGKPIEDFGCTFYGDFSLPVPPTTFNEAMEICNDIQGCSFAKNSVLKTITLLPLSALTQGTPQAFHLVKGNLASQVEEILESFDAVKLRGRGLVTSDVCCKFDNLRKQIMNFLSVIELFKENFARKISILLPKIRNCEADESELEKLIASIRKSPFCQKEMNKFLRSKGREIQRLSVFLKKLTELKTPEITFDFPSASGKLEQLIAENETEYILCFTFNTISDSVTYIKNLETFMDTEDVTSLAAESKEWFSQADELEKKLANFIEFAQTNASSGNLAFVVTDRNEDSDEEVAAMVLYSNGDPSDFEPPEKPKPPQCGRTTIDSVELSWTPLARGADAVTSYNIFYSCDNSPELAHVSAQGSDTKIIVKDLLPGREYKMSIQAVSKSGVSPQSNSCKVTTKKYTRPADRILKHAHLIRKGKPAVYQLPLVQVHEDRRNGLYKCQIGVPSRDSRKPERVLMVLGATGAGKSTLINGIANYVFGINWEDDFRFKIISDDGNQSYSQTKAITAYSLYSTKLPYTLTIIDTPGFGDTGGIERDKYIAQQIKTFFSVKGGIDTLHGIGFVTQASLARLTPTQRYIFDAVLSIFGKDISENIFLLCTFADAIKPPVLQATKTANIPYQESFKFNNSALYASNEPSESPFNSMFWKMGHSSFEHFFEHFLRADPKSLALTREVLKERDMLEMVIPGLQDQVRIGLIQLDVIQQEERVLRQHEADLNANKNFTYSIDVTKFRKNHLPHGRHTTACNKCNFTCHQNCGIPRDEDKAGCWAMSGGNCRICPDKCHWSSHSNLPYIIEYYADTETRTSEDLKRQYDTAKSGKESVVAMIAENEKKLNVMQVEVFMLIEQARESIKRLEEIALKPNPLTELEYLDLLIESERIEARPGFEKRIAQYMKFRKNAEIMKKVVPKVSTKEPKSKTFWQKVGSYFSFSSNKKTDNTPKSECQV